MLTADAALLVGTAGLVGALDLASAFDTDVAGVARVGRADDLAALFLPAHVVLALHVVSVADESVAAGAGDRAAVHLLRVVVVSVVAVGFCGKRNTKRCEV